MPLQQQVTLSPQRRVWRPGLRRRLAIGLARGLTALLRGMRIGGGTTLPGHLALLVAPDLLDTIGTLFPDGIVLVSATNGKTTVTAMLRSILEGAHGSGGTRPRSVASNASGANLPHGILASLLMAPAEARLAVLEVDEAYLHDLATRLRPRLILLGALFRDQLDRHGEIDAVAARWQTMVAGLDRVSALVISADDPRLEALLPAGRTVVRCGVDDPQTFAADRSAGSFETAHCQFCGRPFDYSQRLYGHLGDYLCPGCEHRRGRLDLWAGAVRLEGMTGVRFELRTPRERQPVHLPLPGLHNLENALLASGAALSLGIDMPSIAETLAKVRPAFGRGERLAVEGRQVMLMLIKNPVAADQTLRTIASMGAAATAGQRSLLLALHDGDADSRDISWIWDIDLESLLPSAGFPPGASIHVAGERGVELALRLRYAGVPLQLLKLYGDPVHAFGAVLADTLPGGSVFVLATYSPMLRLHRYLAARGAAAMFWST